MMKNLVVFLFLIMTCFAQAQSREIDSLKHELSIAPEDSNKVRLYLNLCWPYFFNAPDTAFFYGQQALQLAQKIKFKRGEAEAYNILWVPFFVKGEYARALEYAYKGLHLNEELNNDEGIAGMHGGFSNIFREQGDLERALEHAYAYNRIKQKLGDTKGHEAINIHGNLAQIFDEANQLDSAYIHARIGLDTAASLRSVDNMTAVMLNVIANVSRKKKDYTNALIFYRQALPIFADEKIVKDQITTNNGISESFLRLGQIDSALWYANAAYELRLSGSFLKGSQQTVELMAQIYKAKRLNDSTIKFLELSNALRNELYSQAKERQIQDMAFNEKLRQQELLEAKARARRQLWTYGLVTGCICIIILAGILWRSNRRKQKDKIKIETAYEKLKSTQAQLIQSEKMASLGELTAGIAHEIQNPLNFVNNFSEVNNELIEEVKIKNEKLKIDDGEVNDLLADIYQNNEKISMHGKRADAIVKGMLQHSRMSSGQTQLTDINAIADEYLRLAYHGLRAKDKSFNAKVETDFNPSLPQLNVVRQDVGRVILNLVNNAFYAVGEKAKLRVGSYEPLVRIGTKKLNDKIEINIRDNGNGIPQKIVDKIFQPFYTTKPTGQGTGLGLSLAYDIIKAYGGEIRVESKEGEGSEFTIRLPIFDKS